MRILEGRAAIVTGASSGIGRACAVRFAEEGAAVVVCARRLDKLDELVREVVTKGGQATAVSCDVAKEEDIESVVDTAVERYGGVDILANIAQGGIDDLAGLVDATAERALYSFVTGPLQSMLFMKKCFPHMKRQRYGRIINAGSLACILGTPGLVSYELAKGAIMALTRSASQEWGEFGIVTNTFLPVVRTEAFDDSQFAERADEIAAQIPVRRLGTAYDDCAPVLAFLASESAGYLNGQAIGIDGGKTLIA